MHNMDPREREELISAYIDGELTPEQAEQFEAHMDSDAVFRREVESMKALTLGTAAALCAEAPPAEVWDTYLDSVYNQLERRTGWVVFVLGALLLALYGLVLFVAAPWASPLTKLLISVPVVGLFILFVSVLRQRLAVAKTDRYTKEVQR